MKKETNLNVEEEEEYEEEYEFGNFEESTNKNEQASNLSKKEEEQNVQEQIKNNPDNIKNDDKDNQLNVSHEFFHLDKWRIITFTFRTFSTKIYP